MHSALLTALALFALLGHGYFWVAIVNRLHAWAGPRRLIDFLTHASFAAFIVLPPMIAWQWQHLGTNFLDRQATTRWPWFLLVYCLECAFFGLGKLLARFVSGFREDDPHTVLSKQRLFVEPAQPWSASSLHGFYPRMLGFVPGNQALRLAIDTKQLLIPRLPAKLVGLRIAHISDLHVTGRVGPEWFRWVVDEVNKLAADVIMVTGDLIEQEAYRDWLNENLALLRAKYGVYFILGNHDYFIDAQRTIADLTKLGLIYMGGKKLIAEWNGHPVLIAGNEVPWHRELSDLAAIEQSTPFRLLLMHSPDQFDWACAVNGDLALAGHTHGGQICFPILGAVAAPSLHGTRFAGGTFRRGNTIMHVTRGISGETPMRWLCPPEIAVLELVSTKT
ncbi:MAG: metallophosphoesterase [Bythopirellula sp.]|nr:metallophosphoesterase [Bythopirellula sp.]